LLNGAECYSIKNFAELDIKSLNVCDFKQYVGAREYIFITGATGFIGARVLQNLLKLKCKICCLVRDPSIESVLSKLNERVDAHDLSEVKFLFP
jgi:FlaA1/EpsC-like NDP-sugar epimerase